LTICLWKTGYQIESAKKPVRLSLPKSAKTRVICQIELAEIRVICQAEFAEARVLSCHYCTPPSFRQNLPTAGKLNLKD